MMESGARPNEEKASNKGQTSTYNCLQLVERSAYESGAENAVVGVHLLRDI